MPKPETAWRIYDPKGKPIRDTLRSSKTEILEDIHCFGRSQFYEWSYWRSRGYTCRKVYLMEAHK